VKIDNVYEIRVVEVDRVRPTPSRRLEAALASVTKRELTAEGSTPGEIEAVKLSEEEAS
jgi:hypothetical protein